MFPVFRLVWLDATTVERGKISIHLYRCRRESQGCLECLECRVNHLRVVTGAWAADHVSEGEHSSGRVRRTEIGFGPLMAGERNGTVKRNVENTVTRMVSLRINFRLSE